MIEFKLPSLGADMDEGKLLEWKVGPGDTALIPPGMPHIFTATPGHTFTYLIFKHKV